MARDAAGSRRGRRGTAAWCAAPLLAPDFFGDLHHFAHLGPLLVLGEDVALFRRGEAALRRERHLFHRHELRRLVEPALHRVLALERAALRGDDADHDDLVALWQET